MLVRLKFIPGSQANRMTVNDLEKLSDFLGEKISSEPLKIENDGTLGTLNWRETFEKQKGEEDYTVVTKSDYVQINDNSFFLSDMNEFMKHYPNLETSVKGIPKSISGDDQNLFNRISELHEKIESVVSRFDKQIEFNQKCEVHVPGLGLININRLGFATDKCTEELQEILNRGWRILAVCPQPDQRRPDYILGMSIEGSNDSVDVVNF